MTSHWIHHSFRWLPKVPEFSTLVQRWQVFSSCVVVIWRVMDMHFDPVVLDALRLSGNYTCSDTKSTLYSAHRVYLCVSINEDYRKFSPAAEKIIYGLQETELTENLRLARARYCRADNGSSVAERSKAWLCGRSVVGIACSNPVGSMDVSFVSVVCWQVEASATGWSLVQRSPTECGVSWVW
jgi:hypothetical protein